VWNNTASESVVRTLISKVDKLVAELSCAQISDAALH